MLFSTAVLRHKNYCQHFGNLGIETKTISIYHFRFELEWARIQFEHPSYIVCEDAELLPISVVRTGATNITSSIDIKSKGMSAKEGADYVPSENKILTFEPGENEKLTSVNHVNHLFPTAF